MCFVLPRLDAKKEKQLVLKISSSTSTQQTSQKLGFEFAEEYHPAFRFDVERERQLVLRISQQTS